MIFSTRTSRLVRSSRLMSTLPSRWNPRIDDEDLRERLGQVLGIAHEVDDLADRPERRHRHEVGLHQAAGGLFRIEQVALQRRAVALRKLIEDFLLVGRLEATEQVGGVVAVEVADGARQNVVGQRLRDLVAHLLVDLGQHLEVELGPQRQDQPDAILGLEQLDQIGKIGPLDVGSSARTRALSSACTASETSRTNSLDGAVPRSGAAASCFGSVIDEHSPYAAVSSEAPEALSERQRLWITGFALSAATAPTYSGARMQQTARRSRFVESLHNRRVYRKC